MNQVPNSSGLVLLTIKPKIHKCNIGYIDGCRGVIGTKSMQNTSAYEEPIYFIIDQFICR